MAKDEQTKKPTPSEAKGKEKAPEINGSADGEKKEQKKDADGSITKDGGKPEEGIRRLTPSTVWNNDELMQALQKNCRKKTSS